MANTDKRKEQKRDSIRRAALELFQTYGFKKASIQDVAQHAGVSQVTIYNHFGSREGLVFDVMKWFTSYLVGKYIEIIKSDLPFLDKLESIVLDKKEIISQFQGELVQEVMKSDPKLQAHIDDLYNDQIRPNIINFFNEGAEQGYIHKKYSADTIMLYFEVVRRGLSSIPDISQRMAQGPNMSKDIVDIMTYGLNG
jgi:AcrR family transcriptional regulator